MPRPQTHSHCRGASTCGVVNASRDAGLPLMAGSIGRTSSEPSPSPWRSGPTSPRSIGGIDPADKAAKRRRLSQTGPALPRPQPRRRRHRLESYPHRLHHDRGPPTRSRIILMNIYQPPQQRRFIMWYRKPIAQRTTTVYQKKFDWFYVIGGTIGGLILFGMYG